MRIVRSFDMGMLNTSTGIAVTWLSGFGPLSFSLSKPLQFTEVLMSGKYFSSRLVERFRNFLFFC